jgi:hypothetical protein
MKPFLRPTDRAPLAPVGWTAEPAGTWAGKTVEVVFDPRRHDVLLLRTSMPTTTLTGIAEAGYRCLRSDGTQQLWARDRIHAAQASLTRHDHQVAGRPAPTIGHDLGDPA